MLWIIISKYRIIVYIVYIIHTSIILLNKSSFYVSAAMARGRVTIYGNNIGIQFILLSYHKRCNKLLQ